MTPTEKNSDISSACNNLIFMSINSIITEGIGKQAEGGLTRKIVYFF